MSLDDMPQVQTQQVSNIPEPVAHMPKVDTAQFKSLDDLINGILDEIGNKVSALAIVTAGKAVDAIASGAEYVANKTSDIGYNPNFVAAGSPQMAVGNSQDGPSQGRGRDVSDSQAVGSERSESTSLPTRGQQVAAISGATHIPDGTEVQPNVQFGKGPSQGQGHAV